jgi:hypothetical protein
VRSPTDYDTDGFPVYHRSVTDDWSRTRINPNGATKVLALAALQKMNDSATGMVLELSATADSNPGTFRISVPASGGTQQIAARSAGTVAQTRAFVGEPSLAGPARTHLSLYADIAAPLLSLVANGLVRETPADQGTGAYLENDLYFGARAGTSLFVNTITFAPETIIFALPGDTISPAHIARLQAGYAKAAGVPA